MPRPCLVEIVGYTDREEGPGILLQWDHTGIFHSGGPCDGTALTILTIKGKAGEHSVPIQWVGDRGPSEAVPLRKGRVADFQRIAFLPDTLPMAACMVRKEGWELAWCQWGSTEKGGEEVPRHVLAAARAPQAESEEGGGVKCWEVGEIDQDRHLMIDGGATPRGPDLDLGEWMIVRAGGTTAIARGGATGPTPAAEDGRETE